MFLNFSGLRALVSYRPFSYNKQKSVAEWNGRNQYETLTSVSSRGWNKMVRIMESSNYGEFELWRVLIMESSNYGEFELWRVRIMESSNYGEFELWRVRIMEIALYENLWIAEEIADTSE